MKTDGAKPNTQTSSGYTHRSGEHTWDRIVHRHICPKCKWVFDSRHDYHYKLDHWEKTLECPRCTHLFHVKVSSYEYEQIRGRQ